MLPHPLQCLSKKPFAWPLLLILTLLTFWAGLRIQQAAPHVRWIRLELEPRADEARGLLDKWTTEYGPEGVREGLHRDDCPFIPICYTTIGFGCLIVGNLYRWGQARSRNTVYRRIVKAGNTLAWLLWLAALLDYGENFCLYHTIDHLVDKQALQPWPALTFAFSAPKWLLIAIGLLFFVLMGLGYGIERIGRFLHNKFEQKSEWR